MATQEIPRAEWPAFLDSFSRQHEGWLATLEVLSNESGAQEEAHELPLEGITSTFKEGETIAISLGNAPEDHITHVIAEPTHVWLEQTAQGANEALQIESANAVKTLLRFRSTMPVELVDGVVGERGH